MVSEPDPFRQQLAAARHYGNMSQEQLAKALGITKSTLARWESGNTPPPQDLSQRQRRRDNPNLAFLGVSNRSLALREPPFFPTKQREKCARIPIPMSHRPDTW